MYRTHLGDEGGEQLAETEALANGARHDCRDRPRGSGSSGLMRSPLCLP
jgi:hypothetical protein